MPRSTANMLEFKLHYEEKSDYAHGVGYSGPHVIAQCWKNGMLIAESKPVFCLFMNCVALAIIDLGNKMNTNEINIKMQEQILKARK